MVWSTERKAIRLVVATLRLKPRAAHAQTVSISARIYRSRPPDAVRVLIIQKTIAPVEVPGEYIRKRIPAGFGGAGGEKKGYV